MGWSFGRQGVIFEVAVGGEKEGWGGPWADGVLPLGGL